MITVSEFVNYMKITIPISEEMEEFIKQCILASVDEMNTFTNRILVEMDSEHMTIVITEKTEYYDGYNSNILYLNNHPVIDFGEERENALMYLENKREWKSILRTPDTIEDSVMALTFGKIVLLKNYVFPTGTKNIKITYLSGYSAETLPGDLKRVCYEKTALKYMNSSFHTKARLGIQFYDDDSGHRTRFREEDFEKMMKKYRRRVV